MNKFLNRSLQFKIISVCIFANILIFMVNLFLLFGINNMSKDMELVYQDNRSLNQLSEALSRVQDTMTVYLSSKTSESLEDYYREAQHYSDLILELDDTVTDLSFTRMERNIRYMSQNYLDEVAQTIEAKRGRNVEKYRTYYESSTKLYEDIDEYIEQGREYPGYEVMERKLYKLREAYPKHHPGRVGADSDYRSEDPVIFIL